MMQNDNYIPNSNTAFSGIKHHRVYLNVFVQCGEDGVEHIPFYDPVTPVKGISGRIECPPLHFNILYLQNKNQCVGLH